MIKTLNANGIEMAYACDGNADAPAVILAHGLAADLSMWEPQLAVLQRHFAVLRYDIRGHGGTSATSGDYSLALLAFDILALMDALSIRCAHFVGTSLGGMVGQYLAITRPERLLSLTLCATTHEVPRQSWSERVQEVRQNGVISQVESTIERWFSPIYRTQHPQNIAVMRRMILRTTDDGYAGCAAAIRDMNLAAAIRHIHVPTLIVAGEQDLSTPLPLIRRLADGIAGAELVVVPEAAHMPTIEQPAACNAAILQFLNRIDEARENPRGAFCGIVSAGPVSP